jgi:hypothetical protein
MATGEDATGDGEASEGGKVREGGGRMASATMFGPINHVDHLPPSTLKVAIN